MKLFSTSFDENTEIPDRFSYRGGNISPALSFVDVPLNAASLAVICHDPDAAVAGGFTHWLMWNIDPNLRSIEENMVPRDVVLGETDWGENKWGGPAPPTGTHHYIFYVYALSSMLDLPVNTRGQALQDAMKPYIIESASLTGLYTAR